MKLTAESTVLDDKKIGDSFATLQVEADGIRTEVGTKVGNNEVISRINQTAESVKIQANKINIDGIITAVNDNTTTTIDGDKITTGTLGADKIKVNEIQIGAAQIASGTIDTARIPNLSSEKITVGSQTLTTALNGKAASGAENTANHYITDVTSTDGIRVHDSHTSNNSIVINSSGMEVFKGGTTDAYSVAKYGDSARIGKAATRHVEVTDGGMQVYSDTSSLMAHIGYGNGNAQSGTATTPYYTLGRRASGAVGNWSLAVGDGSYITASGYNSFAQGHAQATNYLSAAVNSSYATGDMSFSCGASHAEASYAFASGQNSYASHSCSAAFGSSTKTSAANQVVIGQSNADVSNALFIIGGGNSSNVLAALADGNLKVGGGLYIGCNADSTGGVLFDTTPRAWTPHLYDLGTLLRPLPTAQYIKLGKIVIAWFSANNPNLSGINTMMQIRNLPMSSVIAGQLYIGTMTGSGSTITTQIADGAWYPRPNIKSSQFGNPTGYVTFCLIGLA